MLFLFASAGTTVLDGIPFAQHLGLAMPTLNHTAAPVQPAAQPQ